MIALLFTPLLALVAYPAGRRFPKLMGFLLVTAILISAGSLAFMFADTFPAITLDWFRLGNVQISLSFLWDSYTFLMLAVIFVVGLLVSVYSTSYLKVDRGSSRYFSFLGLFLASMTLLVVSGNLLLMFFGWELVGLSSYLLIGFWYKKPAAAAAAKKAFLVNRFGDVALLLVLMLIWGQYRSFDLPYLVNYYQPGSFWIPFLLILAASAKSAQLFFLGWLPDAMEGPTPASALIHAATMVAAGVYLLVRFSFTLDPTTQGLLMISGLATSIYAAILALGSYDLKRILAFSTISQLGLMYIGLASGFPENAFFHLVTHAFFKAGLFLAAGIFIHRLSALDIDDPQDIRGFSSLSIPVGLKIAWAILLLGLTGMPLFSGFLSKEAILSGVVDYYGGNDFLIWLVGALLVLSFLLTAWYVVRLWKYVGNGSTGSRTFGAWTENAPVFLLAALSIFAFYSINPFDPNAAWLFYQLPEARFTSSRGVLSLGASLVPPIGLLSGWFIFRRQQGGDILNLLASQKGYIDHFYKAAIIVPVQLLSKMLLKVEGWLNLAIDFFGKIYVVLGYISSWMDTYILDGLINFTALVMGKVANVLRQSQKGSIQQYIVWSLLGVILLVIWMIS